MLTDKLKLDYNEALRNHETLKVSVIRMLISEIKNKEIDLRGESKELTDSDILQVLNKELKKRKESADIFAQNNRQEMADQELAELSVIETYLPKQLSTEEIEQTIKQVKEKTGATDFGTLMKASMVELKGKADGKIVGEIVKKLI